MNIRITLLGCAVLAGCAAPPPLPDYTPRVLTPEAARELPAAEVCLGVSIFRPGNAAVAAAEVQRRGLNCADHAAGMAHVQRQLAQPAPAPVQALPPMPEIRPIEYPRTVYCNTYPGMGGMQTICR